MPGALINGVLVEGLNYSGKTTLARMVARELTSRGLKVQSGHCYLCSEPIVESLQDLSFNGLEDKEANGFPDAEMMRPFNAFRSAQIIVDSQFAAQKEWPVGFLVQDRQWFSQLCNNEFFTPGESFLSAEWIAHHAPQFTVQVYLTCTPRVRLERLRKRPTAESHALNTYLRANVDSFPRFEETCLELVDRYGGFEVVNTDDLDVTDLARSLVDRLVPGPGSTTRAGAAAGVAQVRSSR